MSFDPRLSSGSDLGLSIGNSYIRQETVDAAVQS